jgi:hypothetical protein
MGIVPGPARNDGSQGRDQRLLASATMASDQRARASQVALLSVPTGGDQRLKAQGLTRTVLPAPVSANGILADVEAEKVTPWCTLGGGERVWEMRVLRGLNCTPTCCSHPCACSCKVMSVSRSRWRISGRVAAGELHPCATRRRAPAEGDEHEQETTHHACGHGGSSLRTDSGTWHGTAALGAHAGTNKRHAITRSLCPSTIHLERAQISTTS